jgi:uncharacterized membrane protein
LLDALFAMTALPNLHPALVHFPIALSVAALLFDAVLWIRWYSAPVDRTAAALWILAAAAAGAAYAAGRVAADGLGALSPEAEATLASHADVAFVTASALDVLALLRAWLAWRCATRARARRGVLRILALLGALIVQGLVAYTADLGGALVFRHGVAVSEQVARAAPAANHMTATSSQHESATPSKFAHLEDGSLAWEPRAGEEAVLGAILTPVGANAVRVTTASEDTKGLSLAASGRTLLVFPEEWKDVRLEVRADLSAFDGTVALGARVEGDSTGGFVRIRSDGDTVLVLRRAGEDEILDEAKISHSRGEQVLGLSAVGRHWKGFIDGTTVVHGHSQLPNSGRTAILLDGAGTIRLISVRISPVSSGKVEEKARDEHSHGG